MRSAELRQGSGHHAGRLVGRVKIGVWRGAKALVTARTAEEVIHTLVLVLASTRGGGVHRHSADGILCLRLIRQWNLLRPMAAADGLCKLRPAVIVNAIGRQMLSSMGQH